MTDKILLVTEQVLSKTDKTASKAEKVLFSMDSSSFQNERRVSNFHLLTSNSQLLHL